MLRGNCIACINGKLPEYHRTCVDCGLLRNNFEPITNADRIRAMTGMELAEWLDNVCKSAYDEGYTKETDDPLMSPYPSTASEWLVWMKEEVGDGD